MTLSKKQLEQKLKKIKKDLKKIKKVNLKAIILYPKKKKEYEFYKDKTAVLKHYVNILEKENRKAQKYIHLKTNKHLIEQELGLVSKKKNRFKL